MALFVSGASAQTPITIPNSAGLSDARSPSITSCGDVANGINKLVCAFVTTETNLPRVHVATSTNDGASWTDNGAPDNDNVPSFINNNSAACLDQPQVIADGYTDVTLIAHGYDQSTYKGAYSSDGTYPTLFTTAGIYYSHSTDGGVTWTAWQKIWQTSGSYITVDHPRVALRRDYGDWVNDVPLCVVWEQRSWNMDGTTIPSTSIVTKIGMAFFSDGSLYPPGAGGTDYYTGINTGVTGGYYPMRPSVAISPDGQIWLSYYAVTDMSSTYPHTANYYVQSGSVSISGSPAKATPSFTTSNIAEVSSGENLEGDYDPNRGYFFTPESQVYPDFNDEFDQGPSIQVAVSNIYQCEPTYTVGLAYTHADAHYNIWSDVDHTSPDVNRWLAFWYASVPFLGTPNVTWNERDKLDYTDDAGKYQMFLLPELEYSNNWDDKHYSQSPDGGYDLGVTAPGRLSSFFVLSYLHAERCTGNVAAGDNIDGIACRTGFTFDNTFGTGSIFQNAELFYQNACKDEAMDIRDLGSQIALCGEQSDLQFHTAWHHLGVGDGAPADQLYENNGGAIIAQAYLDGYPYNDRNAFPTVTGSPYLYFNFDGIGQPSPSAISFPSTYTSPSPTAGIAAGLGNFVFNTFVPAISPTVNPVPYGEYWGHYTTDQSLGKTDFGSLNTSDQRKIVMTENIAHAVFEENSVVYYSEGMPNIPMGDGNDRDWTQPIAIGGVPAPPAGTTITQTLPSIAVYEEDGENAVRTAELAMGIYPASGLPESPDRYDGLSSIAITWTELTSTTQNPNPTAAIKIRTREFNACTGVWADWSPIQTVYSSPYTYETGTCDGISIPVPVSTVAPLAWPKPYPGTDNGSAWQYQQDKYQTNYTFLPTNLIGWVTTWGDDNGDYNGVLNNGVDILSRTLLRPYKSGSTTTIDNSNWGTYTGSNFWPPVASMPNPIYTDADPGTVCENFFSYMSSTNQENKAEDSMVVKPQLQNPPGTPPAGYTSNPRQANYQIDVAFSTSDGSINTPNGNVMGGLGTGSAMYGTNSGTLGSPGSYGFWNKVPMQVFTPLGPSASFLEEANNPDITVNSSGQQFLAWQESTLGWILPSLTPTTILAIGLTNTYYEGSWLKNGNPNVVTYIDETPSEEISPNGYWMSNPSIAGSPKTGQVNGFGAGPDYDLGEVQLLLWQRVNATGSLVNNLIPWDYQEMGGVPGLPDPAADDAGWTEQTYQIQTGTNPQVSFTTMPFNGSPALMTGNSATTANTFITPVSLGSYKIGVFDSIRNFALYRSEGRVSDSAMAKFVWGDPHVMEPGDSIGYQIKLAYGIDTAGWASHDEVRDSIFRTQPFELDLGATVSYFRGGYVMAADSTAALSSFNQNDTMRYWIEMVHGDGHVDTLERLTYAPGAGAYLLPSTITTQPSLLQTDTVYLRVEGSVSGFSDADSLCKFANEINLGHYASYVDSTLQTQHSPAPPPSQSALQVLDAYPSPIAETGANTTVVLSCPKGLIANITLVDATGRMLGSAMAQEGTSNWMTSSIPVPAAAGEYFLQISDGVDSKVVPISVIR